MNKPRRNFRGRGRRDDQFVANRRIRFPEVRVLSERGEPVGIMSTSQALELAREEDKDLVLITEQAKPPVAKIIELAKHKYQQQQRESENRKKARKQDIKEVRFTPFIGENDFQTRLKKINKFLEKGDKVRITVEFRRGRQITKKEFGYETFDKVFAATQEIADIEIKPKMVGKRLIAQLNPSNKKKTQD